jgi:hypothetical protein
LSLFGLIALPVVVGGVVDEVDDEDDVRETDDDVEEEAEEEGGLPELSCLIKSAARSAYSSAPVITISQKEDETHQTVEDRHQMR